MTAIQEVKRQSIVPVPQPPFLGPMLVKDREFTLVLDLDETLIHFFEMQRKSSHNDYSVTDEDENALDDSAVGGHFLIRPGA